MAPPQRQSQQSPAHRPPDLPDGLPTLNSQRYESVDPMLYQTPGTLNLPHTPTTPSWLNPNPELTASSATAQSHRKQLQQAYDQANNIRARIRDIVNQQNSDHWNAHWLHYHAQSNTANEEKKLELQDKVGDLTAKYDDVKAERARLWRERTGYRKTVFRLSSLLALRHHKAQASGLERLRLLTRIVDLKRSKTQTEDKHAEELRAKQKAVDKANQDLQTQASSFQQKLSDADKTFKDELKLNQDAWDKETQFRQSIEVKLQKANDETFEINKQLALSKNANAELQRKVEEVNAARDQARKNEEAQRRLDTDRLIALQADVDSCNARLADDADKHKALVDELRSEKTTVNDRCAVAEAQCIDLTQQLAKEQAECKVLHDKLKASTITIDGLSNQLLEKEKEVREKSKEITEKDKEIEKLQRKLVKVFEAMNSNDSDPEPGDMLEVSKKQANDDVPPKTDTLPEISVSSDANTKELTPPETPRLAQAAKISAPTPSPITPPLRHCLPPRPSISLSDVPTPQSAPSRQPLESANMPVRDPRLANAERSTAIKHTPPRPLSQGDLAKVGRIEKKPGTEIKPPNGPKSNVPQRRDRSPDRHSPNKRRRSNY